MVSRATQPTARNHDPADYERDVPRPTTRFRLEAWRTFQRALDPLGKPRPYRPPPIYR